MSCQQACRPALQEVSAGRHNKQLEGPGKRDRSQGSRAHPDVLPDPAHVCLSRSVGHACKARLLVSKDHRHDVSVGCMFRLRESRASVATTWCQYRTKEHKHDPENISVNVILVSIVSFKAVTALIKQDGFRPFGNHASWAKATHIRRHAAPSAGVLVRLVNPPQCICPMLQRLLMVGVLHILPVRSFQKMLFFSVHFRFSVKSKQRMRHGETSWWTQVAAKFAGHTRQKQD